MPVLTNTQNGHAIAEEADLAASVTASPGPPPKLRNLTLLQPVLQLVQLLLHSTPQKQYPNNASKPVSTS